ncbi:MAG: hypothetical protein ACI4RC_06920 [Oscillospiraceae bacterium]
MVCPRCQKPVGDNDNVCGNCGLPLNDSVVNGDAVNDKKQKGVKKPKVKKQKASKPPKHSEENAVKADGEKHSNGRTVLITAIICVAAIALVVVIAAIVANISGDEGQKCASSVAKYIGAPVNDAEQNAEYTFKEDSAYNILNKALEFDKIYESKNEIKIDDISYPKWAVTVSLAGNNKVEGVTYTNFESIKTDTRGVKKDTSINLDKLDKGTSFSEVKDYLELEPYSISYKKDKTTYVYKYYYIADNGDAQPVILSVNFDGNKKMLDYASELVYPSNI